MDNGCIVLAVEKLYLFLNMDAFRHISHLGGEGRVNSKQTQSLKWCYIVPISHLCLKLKNDLWGVGTSCGLNIWDMEVKDSKRRCQRLLGKTDVT